LPGWEAQLPSFVPADGPLATRQAVKSCVDATGPFIPGLMPGSADLTGNTGMLMADAEPQSVAHPGGDQIHYGIREHGMGGVMTGMAAHRGVVPAGGTFFVFSDYMRGSVRLAAISEAKVIYFWTHDSVGLGQDGPTHQPVEHLASLRAMPGLRVIRPADANESAQALRVAIERDGPTALILSRQNVPVLEGTYVLAANLEKGAYALVDGGEEPDVVLIGTGSEVAVCVGAAELLAAEGVAARVVSMPSWELFDEQDDEYQDQVLGGGAPTLSVEAAVSFGWSRWADDSVAIDHFGASAPGAEVLAEFGFTADNVAERARALLDELDSFETPDFDNTDEFADADEEDT
jgi:transketolase